MMTELEDNSTYLGTTMSSWHEGAHCCPQILSQHRRYFDDADALLAELELCVIEIKSKWPGSLDKNLDRNSVSKDFWCLVMKRDRLSNSVILFSAMAIEAFLNWYGIYRLGASKYNKRYEELCNYDKLKSLLKDCNSVEITKESPIAKISTKISKRRNSLAHDKAREVLGQNIDGDEIPEIAREAVADMRRFFEEFSKSTCVTFNFL